MNNAIVLHETGGPEKLTWEPCAVAEPLGNEVRMRHTSIGVNYIDTYMRSGLYPIATPAVLGQQGVGVITAIGPQVQRFSVGEKVAYAGAPIGAYATERVISSDALVQQPIAVDDEMSAASLLRGMTAEYLLFRLYTVQPGDYVLVHAAAGATGVILCQWAKKLGARVIGSVGDASRFELARGAGCELVLQYDDPNFVASVEAYTDGKLCHVVYDSVGRDTFNTSLACVKIRGMLVAYGNASGAPAPVDVLDLARQGSIFLTRPRLNEYAATPDETQACARRFFDAIISGTVTPRAIKLFSLADAADAHRHLEHRDQVTTPVLTVS